jgi:hypothetical protein
MGPFDPMQSDNWWGMGTSYGTVGGYALPITTSQNNYNDYSARLGLTLGTGETVAFMFSGLTVSNPGSYLPKSLYVDNVGITAIPEPGSVLGLGCVLASGLMLRSRRKTNRLDLP